ncbi:hypothetical protein, variant [Cladophialophora immunda]|nr:hypothetical protein, variant [Cladophialophora immunda]KIW34771.1 hypothetical protein, variant [Cladophialophora immunda]
MVTSSPDSINDMLGPSVQVTDITRTAQNNELQIIRLLDPSDRTFFLPVEQCRTWFAVMDKVVGLCGRRFGDLPELYHLKDKDGIEITAPDWQPFISSQTEFSVTIRVSLCSTAPPPEAPLAPGGELYTPPDGDWLSNRKELVIRAREDDRYERPSRSIVRETNRRRQPLEGAEERPRRRNTSPREKKRNQRLEREVAEVMQFDQPKSSEATISPASVVDREHVGAAAISGSLPSRDPAAQDLVDSPSELSEASAEEKAKLQVPQQLKHKKVSDKRGAKGNIQISYPAIDPIRTSTLRSTRRSTHRGESWALIPYKPPPEATVRSGIPSRRPERHTRQLADVERPGLQSSSRRRVTDREEKALVRREDTTSEIDFHYGVMHRPKQPKYEVRNIPTTITNTVRGAGGYDHIFYVPRDIYESLKNPPKEMHNVTGLSKNPEMAGNATEDIKAREQLGDTRVSGEEEKQPSKPPEPTWKVNQNEGDQQPAPPLPVFLWPTGNLKPKQPGNLAPSTNGTVGRESSDRFLPGGYPTTSLSAILQDTSDLQVLNFILAQVDSNLTQGNRVMAHRLGGLSEKEGPIYKGLLESSKQAVAERVNTLCKESLPVRAEGEMKSHRDIFPKIQLCFDILVELLEFFLPQDYPSVVIKKFWYAVEVFIKGLQQLMSANKATPKSPSTTKVTETYYVVRADSAPRRSGEPELKLPELDINRCHDCLDQQSYSQLADVIQHLRASHFIATEVSEMDLKEWIRTSDEVAAFQLECDAKRLVDEVLSHCTSLRTMKNDIIAGTCRDRKFESSTYRLPNGLVKGFERILIMMAYSGYAVSSTHQAYRKSPREFRSFMEIEHINHIVELGYAAEGAFEEAKNNLMLMSRVNEFSSSIHYDTVGPEYFLMMLLGDLKDRVSKRHPLDLIGIYQKQLDRLTYEINNRPRRRLLQEIQSLEEEALAVTDLTEQGWLTLSDYYDKLNPRGFKTTTTTRDALFYDFELPLYGKLLRDSREDLESYSRILDAIPRIRSLLVQSVEIQQEDHGKAILVFTIVTIIFLPMSFVASLLGMNTKDIRSLDEGQWIFWAAAMPLTVLVVAISVWVGYRSESLSLQLWHIRKRLFARQGLSGYLREQQKAMNEAVHESDYEALSRQKLSRWGRKSTNVAQHLNSRHQMMNHYRHSEHDGEV